MDSEQLQKEITALSNWIPAVKEEMGKVLVGQAQLVDRLIIGLLCKHHILLEGVPGLAKTLTINALAGCLHVDFSRIQFTPDLLPSDLIGTMIYNPQEGNFSSKLGPVFSNIILADEINRAPAKVQSALLEAMQERQVTLGEKTYKLPDPFLVLATQNPIDQEGTYQLPEAQLDRFLFKVTLDYPTAEQELVILDRMATSAPVYKTKQVADPKSVIRSIELVNQIYIDPAVRKYIVDIVQATRQPETIDPALANLVRAGASPRATINMALAARARAFTLGRAYVTPQDIKDLAPDILRHRILPSYEAEAEDITTDAIVEKILSGVVVP
ncbi:AAA family ATPase [Persicirhabdus sediminis]|uniref:MoxR family ATPase n=1 Tax=Persicirhabdus sediminis TaxID=454144 RepID=A0A8J7MFP7_9BACT|nr:MoxR family ATPase [Persicirhabdus sediminis]MBK1791873.1 MoxR family ATPase [Persicirhabdus sediminis]